MGVLLGENSISISPVGVGDVVRWTASQAALASGDIGMDVATGRIRQFRSGASRDVVDVSDLAGTQRLIASGQTLLVGAATVTLATVTRMAGETLSVTSFVTNNVNGARWSEGVTVAAVDAVVFFFERTTNANEFLARATNGNLIASRTVDWRVIGIS